MLLASGAIAEIELSRTDMAAVIGVTARRLDQLAKEGRLHKLPNGCFNLVETVQAWIRWEHEKAKGDGPKTLEEAKIRLTTAQAEKTELEVGALLGELHPAASVEAVWSDMIGAFKARIMSIPTKLAPLLAGRKNPNEIQSILKGATNEALQELSEYDPEKIAHGLVPEDSADRGAASGNDDIPVGGQ